MSLPKHDKTDDSAKELEFTKLLLENERAIFGFIYSLTQDFNASEELRQELASRLWTKFDQFDGSRPFVAWAIGFARLMVLEWRRAQAKLPIPMDDEVLGKMADAAAERAENRSDIQAALHECAQDLTALQKKALHARYFDGTSVQEIAQAWNRTQMAVYKVLNRIHESLADCMREKLNLATNR
ncbi:MAG: sigma-70 family RNA polymerase sigma factor [Verrucomicrobiota bacterium]